jgi:hypothetical protein
MKSFILSVAAFFLSLSSIDAQTAVYYSPVSSNMEIGVGFDVKTREIIFSVVEESGVDVQSNITVLTRDGKVAFEKTDDEATEYIVPKDENSDFYIHSYKMNPREYFKLITNLNKFGNIIVIDGVQVSSRTFIKAMMEIFRDVR